jgi:hypothetical protein
MIDYDKIVQYILDENIDALQQEVNNGLIVNINSNVLFWIAASQDKSTSIKFLFENTYDDVDEYLIRYTLLSAANYNSIQVFKYIVKTYKLTLTYNNNMLLYECGIFSDSTNLEVLNYLLTFNEVIKHIKYEDAKRHKTIEQLLIKKYNLKNTNELKSFLKLI